MIQFIKDFVIQCMLLQSKDFYTKLIGVFFNITLIGSIILLTMLPKYF